MVSVSGQRPTPYVRQIEARRIRFVSVAFTLLLAFSASACSNDPPRETNPSRETGVAEASKGVTSPAKMEANDFAPELFGKDSANVDNPYFPMEPGKRYVWKGRAFTDDGERVDRKVVFTVTDLTKVVGGIRAAVGWDRDFNDGSMGESELIFHAQDKFGNVWHLGEYVEHWDDGELDGGRVWVVGDPQGAQAGLAMHAEPRVGSPSYSQGFSPPPWFWNDRARVADIVKTCVPVGCFDKTLVVEEFEPREPGAFQLKYYAQGVGNVRVGWRGPKEEEKEVMALTTFRQLSPQEMAKARAEALAMEHRAYAYGRTEPAQPLTENPKT
jgi:hypothetical protein